MSITIFIMAALGILGHFFMKFWDSMTTGEKFAWQKHGTWALISAIIVTAALIGGEQINILPEITPWSAFFIGYFSDSFIKNLTLFNPYKDPTP